MAQESGFRKFCGAPPFSGRLPGARQHLCTVCVCVYFAQVALRPLKRICSVSTGGAPLSHEGLEHMRVRRKHFTVARKRRRSAKTRDPLLPKISRRRVSVGHRAASARGVFVRARAPPRSRTCLAETRTRTATQRLSDLQDAHDAGVQLLQLHASHPCDVRRSPVTRPLRDPETRGTAPRLLCCAPLLE